MQKYNTDYFSDTDIGYKSEESNTDVLWEFDNSAPPTIKTDTKTQVNSHQRVIRSKTGHQKTVEVKPYQRKRSQKRGSQQNASAKILARTKLAEYLLEMCPLDDRNLEYSEVYVRFGKGKIRRTDPITKQEQIIKKGYIVIKKLTNELEEPQYIILTMYDDSFEKEFTKEEAIQFMVEDFTTNDDLEIHVSGGNLEGQENNQYFKKGSNWLSLFIIEDEDIDENGHYCGGWLETTPYHWVKNFNEKMLRF
jgi:hypothetical protein